MGSGFFAVTSLSKLTVDVFSIIQAFLDAKDIQNARLSGRELHFFLSPYLFHTISFGPHKSCLEKIALVERHPHLSRNVQTLKYDVSMFRLPMIKEETDRFEFHSYADGNDSDLLYPSDIKQHMYTLELYIGFVAEQKTLLSDLENLLLKTLDRFPGISRVIVVNTFMADLENVPFKNALQRDSISRKWVRPSQTVPLFSAIARSKCKITEIGVEGHYVQKRYPDNELAAWSEESEIPGSIKYCFPDLDSVRYWKEKKPYFTSAAFDLRTDVLFNMQSIFQNLTNLDLCVATIIPMHNLLSRPPPKAYWSSLPKIIQNLPNIVNLSLDLKVRRKLLSDRYYYYFHNDVAEIFGRTSLNYPHLKTLRIAQVRSSTQALLDLIQNNPQIENLSLKYIIRVLQSSNGPRISFKPCTEWRQGFEMLRDMKLKRLELIGIESFGIDFQRHGVENTNLQLSRIHDYILHGYGNNPYSRQTSNKVDWDTELW